MKKFIQNSNNAVIFARVSTAEQTDGFSLDAQLETMRKYCASKGLNIIKEYNISESSTVGKRSQFYEMIEYVKKQPSTTAIIVASIDRLQRGFKESSTLTELVEQNKITLHFLRENTIITKDSNSTELLSWDMGALFAKAYVSCLRENVKRSVIKKLEAGEAISSVPLGYKYVRDNTGKSYVVIDEERAPLVRKMFEEYATGIYSLEQAAQKSIDLGLTNIRSNKPLSKQQFQKMVKNPFYYGYQYHTRTNKLYKHNYPAIISKELFEKCNQIRSGKKPSIGHQKKKEFIFSGLVRCKHCGCLYTPELKTKPNGQQYIYLRPFSKVKNCICQHTNEKYVLDEVYKQLKSISFDADIKKELSTELKKAYKKKEHSKYAQLSECKLKLEKVITQSDKLLELLLDGTISKEVYESKYQMLKDEQINLEQQITLMSTNTDEKELDKAIDTVLDFANNIQTLFESSSFYEKRLILKNVFSNFLLDGRNPQISLKKEYALLSKTGERQNWWALRGSNSRPSRCKRDAPYLS